MIPARSKTLKTNEGYIYSLFWYSIIPVIQNILRITWKIVSTHIFVYTFRLTLNNLQIQILQNESVAKSWTLIFMVSSLCVYFWIWNFSKLYLSQFPILSSYKISTNTYLYMHTVNRFIIIVNLVGLKIIWTFVIVA